MDLIGVAQAVLGGLVWSLANVVYVRMRRSGRRGLGRIACFFSGIPGTLIALALVKEGSTPAVEPEEDDDERLLEEVRRDRRLRSG